MALRRSLGFGVLVLYGIGTTIGAGIYALVGEIVAVAGWLAPWSFLAASAMAGLTALSFSELSSRFPRAAGAALYVQEGLGSAQLAQIVGWLVIACGTVSAAALMNGFAGYLQVFVALPDWLVISVAVALLCLLAVWGIQQSAWVAGLISLVEVGGLFWIVGLSTDATDFGRVDWSVFVPAPAATVPILTGAILSFYAYIGFEDMVEVAEEVRDVRRTLPRAILTTLLVTSVTYVVLLTSMLLAVGPEIIAATDAPLAVVYERLTGSNASVLGLIALFAIVNGALIQIIMASRVIFGLANRGQLPNVFAQVNERRGTPTLATVLVAAAVLALALVGNLSGLAETTSLLMLGVFALANLALWRIHARGVGSQDVASETVFSSPRWAPPLALAVCLFFIVHGLSDFVAR